MESLMEVLGLAIVLFATTNIDDLFVLLSFFANRKYRGREIIVGQFAGITVLYGVSAVCSLTSLIIPQAYIGFLGLVPIVMGIKKLFGLRKSQREKLKRDIYTKTHGRIFSVALLTVANGGDNVGVYIPVFATRSIYEIFLIGLVFIVMTAVWCFVACWLVDHPTLGGPIRFYAHRIVPFVLVGLGLLIMFKAGSFELIFKTFSI